MGYFMRLGKEKIGSVAVLFTEIKTKQNKRASRMIIPLKVRVQREL